MSEFSRETLLNIIETDHVQCGEASALARIALAAMDSSESVEQPLDYLQGHKDGLEWAARLAEANHPDTGDWLYDDPIELAKAIRKGPDMPPAQPAPVVPDEIKHRIGGLDWGWEGEFNRGWNACRAAMLAAAPHDTPALNSVQSVVTVPGKWIPVSERMPEVGDIVLTAMGGVVNVGETECSAANCRFFTSVISGRELPATHWMQLPAAPQEVGDA
ncbi:MULTISPECIES: DUF551 domain-containing protein [Klebsiella pneumoniae complex]|uniref:DUF551 domain-containing protein n=1 Tax=Klebsiella pneumoniae complex TaxID=3390273 RepID=UPI001ABA3FD6|nr:MULTISPECIES: DUF551 domain-containing protein [Klebsiella]MCS4384534.1 DUF551 domain-containing protein [Klebsiella quasipneumoniae subsp. similipneumoniae]MCS4411338.1 DUF551 domain-containing protein [Klebsiella quasipneumoniae subsp. similipneumoniae]WPI69360.1 DUF551 domain-containing protein [Klebsiella pneumoniae]